MSKNKFIDDIYTHLESDIEKIRVRHRQYISYSNEAGAKSVVMELLNNSLDECRTPRSPGDNILVEFDERSGVITVTDNGRGMPTKLLEKTYTSLNMGSNIDTITKANLKSETLGQNGTGTLAICGLGEYTDITSFRGGTENVSKRLVFEEGVKVKEEDAKCPPGKHGMLIKYKPSKVMGKNTRIIWNDIRNELLNLQYLNKKKITISSHYTDKNGDVTKEKYKIQNFDEILCRNKKEEVIGNRTHIIIESDDIIEELDGKLVKRFLSMDIAFVYTESLNPYIDSFSNSNNTVDNGDHLDGTIEALCRYFQLTVKNSLTEREKQSLDIKWEDVKTGLSVVVSLRTNYESLYTGQTKHKIVSGEIRKIILDLTTAKLNLYFEEKPNKLKDLIGIIKMNARARREGDKARTSVIKDRLNMWSAQKMKNYNPCTNKGKEYKELYIVEGDSAKGALTSARDARFQALFAIRGVSANVFKLDLEGVLKNEEFKGLIVVMGCDVGQKFDLNKLTFDKIIIASDADVDGLFIRSLLIGFFFKIFPEIILDNRLFIAEPPLYRVDDKKNPFVINKEDYISRYISSVMKEYKIGLSESDDIGIGVDWLNKVKIGEFLFDTSSYVDEMYQLSNHYKVKDRMIEILVEELALSNSKNMNDVSSKLDLKRLETRIVIEFPELYIDSKNGILIKGVIDGKYQLLEIEGSLVRKLGSLVDIIIKYIGSIDRLVLKSVKTGAEQRLSILEVLKVLRKYQPTILHRFKGLGQNDREDIITTIMDPNTRSLIRVQVSDVENDMEIFHMLRGPSPINTKKRKEMMRSYKIPRDLLDT